MVVFGQDSSAQPKVIEIKKGISPSYIHDGKKIRKLSELEKIILFVNDDEATRLFTASKSLQYAGMPFALVGGMLMGYPVGYALGGKEFNTPVFLSGCGVAAVGIIFGVIADKNRVKAAERYNKVLKEKWNVSIQYVPESNNYGLMLSFRL
jgi:hypothetical protein